MDTARRVAAPHDVLDDFALVGVHEGAQHPLLREVVRVGALDETGVQVLEDPRAALVVFEDRQVQTVEVGAGPQVLLVSVVHESTHQVANAARTHVLVETQA